MAEPPKKKISWLPDTTLPVLYYRRPPPDEPYAYDTNSGTMNSHYGIGRLGPVYDPLDVFRKFPPPPKYDVGYFLYPGFFSVASFGTIAAWNVYHKRPMFSQAWLLAVGAAGGFLAGVFAWKRSRYNAAVRDAHYQRYIELHPEDFPPIERHKFRDTLMKWKYVRGDDADESIPKKS